MHDCRYDYENHLGSINLDYKQSGNCSLNAKPLKNYIFFTTFNGVSVYYDYVLLDTVSEYCTQKIIEEAILVSKIS